MKEKAIDPQRELLEACLTGIRVFAQTERGAKLVKDVVDRGAPGKAHVMLNDGTTVFIDLLII